MSKIIYLDETVIEQDTKNLIDEFVRETQPLEKNLHIQIDKKTGAVFGVCHLKASILQNLGTIDVPLDPEEQPEYRANRDIFEDHAAYERMKQDALEGRVFNDIVAEYTKEFVPESPIKIIGGQHRFNAITLALKSDIDNFHEMKIYFGLDTEQRLDVQLISNINIDVSPDLIDRMYETASGPELRDWCQKVGLLEKRQDFASKRQRGKSITVRDARTFIMNFFKGHSINLRDYERMDTTPILAKNGSIDEEWLKLKEQNKNLWSDKKLMEAGKQFVKLIDAQRVHYKNKTEKQSLEYSEKAFTHAILSSWAYIAGLLQTNTTRLKRHYNLHLNRNPLNAEALAKGRHKTDPENYRGLGTRNDNKERGRFVELFYLQAEKGDGITSALVKAAIAQYHAKKAIIEAEIAKGKI